MENEFKRVQNPYVKCLDQIDRAKKKYYQSCKDAGIVMKQVRYTFNENPNVNQMQVHINFFSILEKYERGI